MPRLSNEIFTGIFFEEIRSTHHVEYCYETGMPIRFFFRSMAVLASTGIRLVAVSPLLFCIMEFSSASADTTYVIRQTFSVSDWPAGSKVVRGWFWMPEDRPGQRVLDFKIIEAPPSLKVTRDPVYGRSWLYAEIAADKKREMKIVSEFVVTREALPDIPPLPAESRELAATDSILFAASLRTDEPHMTVTPEIRRLADEAAAGEHDPLKQARKFFDLVIAKSEHYSKSGTTPKGKCLGDAMECLEGSGDTCTDQHALFIALCRARGIPCRLIFGSRLKPANEGKEHDPGYRCWVLFFVPGKGWLPVDIAAADASPGNEGRWFAGLDEDRIEWAEGRGVELSPASGTRPDLLIRAWVEADGKPLPQLLRTLNFTRR